MTKDKRVSGDDSASSEDRLYHSSPIGAVSKMNLKMDLEALM